MTCCQGQQKRALHFLIPKNYTGWVNIIFSDSNSVNNPFLFSDGAIYIINGNPANYGTRDNAFISGQYVESYFYYDIDSLIPLKYMEYPLKNVFFPRFINLKKWDRKGLTESKSVFTFYVSSKMINIDEVSIDKLPKNPILE